jgi:hypothetical protein
MSNLLGQTVCIQIILTDTITGSCGGGGFFAGVADRLYLCEYTSL